MHLAQSPCSRGYDTVSCFRTTLEDPRHQPLLLKGEDIPVGSRLLFTLCWGLTSQKSSEAIRALKSIFARHGILEILRSDKGHQFACTEFDQFSKEFAFTHITSSPKLPQAHGEAARAVQTVKNAMKKEEDPVKALMSYRATPLENGYIPAEMLFGRKIRTTLPVSSDQLKLSWPDVEKIREHEQKSKLTQL